MIRRLIWGAAAEAWSSAKSWADERRSVDFRAILQTEVLSPTGAWLWRHRPAGVP